MISPLRFCSGFTLIDKTYIVSIYQNIQGEYGIPNAL